MPLEGGKKRDPNYGEIHFGSREHMLPDFEMHLQQSLKCQKNSNENFACISSHAKRVQSCPVKNGLVM